MTEVEEEVRRSSIKIDNKSNIGRMEETNEHMTFIVIPANYIVKM